MLAGRVLLDQDCQSSVAIACFPEPSLLRDFDAPVNTGEFEGLPARADFSTCSRAYDALLHRNAVLIIEVDAPGNGRSFEVGDEIRFECNVNPAIRDAELHRPVRRLRQSRGYFSVGGLNPLGAHNIVQLDAAVFGLNA